LLPMFRESQTTGKECGGTFRRSILKRLDRYRF
jgi:hypothetical protein